MLNVKEDGLTVYILASRQEERYAREFWTHTAIMRRQLGNITWAGPLYVEDMVQSNAVVPAMLKPYVVLGCLSPSVLSALLDQPALRELVEGARQRIPLIFSPCLWDQAPCPFRGLMPTNHQPLTSTSQRDMVFVDVVRRIRETLTSLL